MGGGVEGKGNECNMWKGVANNKRGEEGEKGEARAGGRERKVSR